jgi:bifunctional non-homologous end joining protein LigD
MLACKGGPYVHLVSRTGVDDTARFPEIVAAVAALPARTSILDGEMVVLDEQLVSRFHRLTEPPDNAILN